MAAGVDQLLAFFGQCFEGAALFQMLEHTRYHAGIKTQFAAQALQSDRLTGIALEFLQ